MSRLFQLKEWLTTADAARHLSTLFEEEVTEADVLRLGLDRRLTLSVNFVNHAKGVPGRIVPMKDATLRDVPSDLAAPLGLTVMPASKPIKMLDGIKLDDANVLELGEGLIRLEGVYDLPMIGAEALDVEHEYQALTGGPEVTLSNLNGAFVKQDKHILVQLHESFDENEHMRGSRAALRELEKRIADQKVVRAKAEALRKRHAEDRKAFLAMQKRASPRDKHYPAGGLPPDAVIVVRTAALREFQDSLEPLAAATESQLDKRSETTYQNIIGGLLSLMLGRTPSGRPQSVYKDQAAVIAAMLAIPRKVPGISKRTLELRFPEARRSFDGA